MSAEAYYFVHNATLMAPASCSCGCASAGPHLLLDDAQFNVGSAGH